MKKPPEPQEILESLSEIFAAAKKCDRKALWNALFPNDPDLDPNPRPGYKYTSHLVTYEYHEFLRCISELKTVLEERREQESRTRLMLAIYCHVMEADFPMAVIWNLLRAVDGQPDCWTFKNADGSPCEYPRQKIAEIKSLSDKLRLRVGAVVDQMWNPDIRNAFSHSQYAILADYVVPTKGLSPISRRSMKDLVREEGNPSLADIEKLFVASDTLVGGFTAEYDTATSMFRGPQQGT